LFTVILILLCNAKPYVCFLNTNVFVCKQLARKSKEGQLSVAFIDPQHFSASVINSDPQHVQSTISTVLSFSPGCVLAAHHTGSHYFLVVICPKWGIVWYLDSVRPFNDDGSLRQRDYTSIKAVIDRYISELSYLQSTHLEPVTYLISI